MVNRWHLIIAIMAQSDPLLDFPPWIFSAYLIANRHDNLMEGSQILRVSHSGTVPRHVKGEAFPRSHTHSVIICILRSGEESAIVVPMEGDVQNTRREGKGDQKRRCGVKAKASWWRCWELQVTMTYFGYSRLAGSILPFFPFSPIKTFF